MKGIFQRLKSSFTIVSSLFAKKKQSVFFLFLKKVEVFALKVNNKILIFTDKIIVLYDKYVAGKPKKFFGVLKKLIKLAIDKVKFCFLFVVAFYKKDKKRAIIYFVLLFILYKVLCGIANKFSSLFQTHKNEITVLVRNVVPERVNKDVNCYGYLESENNLQYVSEVRGNVEKILVQEKQYVKEGQLLMVLDSKFTANSYTSAKSILESKRFQYEATKKLYEDGLESKGNLKAVEADLENAISNFESAKKAYNGLMIVAPFSGYIDNIKNKTGAQINPGMLLFTLERNDAMQVKCDVQNLATNEVKIGDEVRVFISGYETAKGKIAVVGDSIDVYTGSRTVLINDIAGLEGFEESVRPGISVMLKITAKANKDTYKISSEALETTDTGAFMVKLINPKSGEIYSKNVWIYDERDGVDYVIGLEPGDYVVERGHEFVDVGEKGVNYVAVNQNDVGSKYEKFKQGFVVIKNSLIDFAKNIPEFTAFLKKEVAKDYYNFKGKIDKFIK